MKSIEQDLLDRYREGLCTKDEKAVIESWYNNIDSQSQELKDNLIQTAKDSTWECFVKYFEEEDRKLKQTKIRQIRWVSIAAAILICSSTIGFYLYQNKHSAQNDIAIKNIPNDISKKAVLTMADGNKFVLGDEYVQINLKDNDLKYDPRSAELTIDKNNNNSQSIQMLSLQTPVASQFSVVLSDGTKVWLNAQSSLIYPSKFNGKQREVILNGEGYFEVASDKNHPFVVTSKNQKVEVLGTHFNILAYNDLPTSRTTLLEGSVKVTNNSNNKFCILKPNQQVDIYDGNINLQQVNAEDAISWKDGYFNFNRNSLEEVMQAIGLWYEMEIIFKDETLKKELFSGSIYHFADVKKVLKKLELVGEIKFIVSANKIIIYRKKSNNIPEKLTK